MSEPSKTSEGQLMACNCCHTPTAQSVLASLGARCFTCYLAYCRAQLPKVYVGDKRQGARSWAHALRRREESGEVLSPTQRVMWREALAVAPALRETPIERDADLNEAKNAAARRIAEYGGASR